MQAEKLNIQFKKIQESMKKLQDKADRKIKAIEKKKAKEDKQKQAKEARLAKVLKKLADEAQKRKEKKEKRKAKKTAAYTLSKEKKISKKSQPIKYTIKKIKPVENDEMDIDIDEIEDDEPVAEPIVYKTSKTIANNQVATVSKAPLKKHKGKLVIPTRKLENLAEDGDTVVRIVAKVRVEYTSGDQYWEESVHTILVSDNFEEEVKEFIHSFYPVEEAYFRVILLGYTYTLVSKRVLKDQFEKVTKKTKKPQNIPMKNAVYCSYYNIKNTNEHNKNNNMCVYDAIEARYNISKEKQYEIYKKVSNDDNPKPKEKQVDETNDLKFFEPEYVEQTLSYEDGVTSKMIQALCKKYDISVYALDLNRVFIDGYRSSNRNSKTLVYFIVNEHMYMVTNKKVIAQISCQYRSQKSTTTKIFHQDIEIKVEESDLKNKQDNILITDDCNIDIIENTKNTNIIFPTSNLQKTVLDIYKKYNFIPKTHETTNEVLKITLNDGPFVNKNIDILVDPTHTKNYDTATIKKLCGLLNIDFNNQGIGKLALEIKDLFNKSNPTRIRFTPIVRKSILENQNNECNSCHIKIKGNFEIDHILPLATGGTNFRDNLQALCKSCHNQKTSNERELSDYLNINDEVSSYNNLTRSIFDSKLMQKHAFVEKVDSVQNSEHLHSIDAIKDRKNILYYSKYDIPVYTVVDEPKIFNQSDEIECGFYYVETKMEKRNYFPCRGNGWYSQVLIEYVLSKGIINKSEIMYKLLPSLTIKAHNYQPFIDGIYKYYNMGDEKLDKLIKDIVNSFIGACAQNTNEMCKSTHYVQSEVDAGYYTMQGMRPIPHSDDEGNTILYAMKKIENVVKDEDMKPLYLHVLDIEAVELHKICEYVKENGGKVVELNTDCVTYEKSTRIPIDTFFWDDDKKVPKLRYEDTPHLLKKEAMKNFERTDKYKLEWNNDEDWNKTTINEVSEEDLEDYDSWDEVFKSLTETVINSKKSWHIDGPAGTGKTTLLKQIIKLLKDTGKNVTVLTPTNKAARMFKDAETIHKKLASMKTKTKKSIEKLEYVVVDEISMIPELFYKVFLEMKRMNPNIKYIMAGDFRQLPPVNDRIGYFDQYKQSRVLYELTGQRIQLIHCKRSDEEVFKLSQNVESINPRKFTNNNNLFVNICYTNRTRKFVNKDRMEKFMKKFVKKNKLATMDIEARKYPDGTMEKDDHDKTICKGMPVICKKNCARLNLKNNETFVISGVKPTKNTLTITSDTNEQIEITKSEFQKMFDLAFCVTCHRMQGSTITVAYGIYDWDIMEEKCKYVAITRGTKIENINFL